MNNSGSMFDQRKIIFDPEDKENAQSEGSIKCCGTCWHRKEEESQLICYVYNENKEKQMEKTLDPIWLTWENTRNIVGLTT